MASRKLQVSLEEFQKNPTPAVLIDLLEVCRKESEWQLIEDTISAWEGTPTPEISYYQGLALLNLDKTAEGVRELRKVVAANPNHFAAKRELEKYPDIEGEGEPENNKKIQVLKNITIVPQKPENDPHYNRLRLRNFFIAFVLLIALVVGLSYLFKKDPEQMYRTLLENPEENFTSLSYAEFESVVENYKMADIREGLGDSLKKAVLWMQAFAIYDFHIGAEEEEILSQFRIYSTLVSDKGRELSDLIDMIEGRQAPAGIALYHKLDSEFPKSEPAIAALELKEPEIITKSNLRQSFYTALLMLRKRHFSAAESLNNRILAAFPLYELSQKLEILIKSRMAVESEKTLDDIESDLTALNNWKALSRERYLYGEAKVALGEAAKRDDVIADGFYSACPGRFFCREIVHDFIQRNPAEAARMALYMKEKMDTNRSADDIKLVLETALANGDYSSCYFAYHELQQFFQNDIDDEVFAKGAECSEKNGYLEEAAAAYEKINEKEPKTELTAKILRMKYRLTKDDIYFNQLKGLLDKNRDNLDILYAFFDVLTLKNEIPEIIKVLEKIYSLEAEENKFRIIDEYLKYGAVFQAVTTLEKLGDNKDARRKLNEIYNRYMLFDKADSKLEIGKNNDKLWLFVREQLKQNEAGEYDFVSREVDKMMAEINRCEPVLLYIKAEAYRNMGDKQRTFAMIDAMLECNKYYLPALAFAAEITYYQGDLTKTQKGLNYILENEKYLSPGVFNYHNYLVLLNAEIMISDGGERKIVNYLKKNLMKNFPFGAREVDRVSDICDKLKEANKRYLVNFLKSNYKFNVPLKDI